MNLRKLRRERAKAGSATVDAKALPAGEPKADARVIDVEPLTEAATGRDEARDAFVRDTFGDAAPPPEAPPAASSSEPPYEGAAPAGGGPKPGEVPSAVDGVTAMMVGLMDGAGQLLGPRFVGGSVSTWALGDPEKEQLSATGRPVVAELLNDVAMTPGGLFLATVAFAYLPRALAGTMERASERRAAREKASHGAVHDARPIVPPAPPAPAAEAKEAPPASPAPPPPPPPAPPKPGTVEAPMSPAEFLRGVARG